MLGTYNCLVLKSNASGTKLSYVVLPFRNADFFLSMLDCLRNVALFGKCWHCRFPRVSVQLDIAPARRLRQINQAKHSLSFGVVA